ncbi:hypothetical protein [Geoalkalibacter halelectricus]|uniref:VOC domain-containing protein n=1 Tax=Geoalkalibacter halelectricus TaxID=2847045 RepID=A0ABY5ZIW8_9BACT|nr:hypothetical protein [Geoalkalibacter halelectricus]MDO3376638.1 hypothetical protein [Geoalkalibacter halelectricus]UWZ78404.1 hypothetical protein L9S41_11990 [Geoalkalibacter halelectricus]
MKPKFTAGRNIAIKIPPHEYAATVHFYADILGLARISEFAPDIVFDFNGKNLWLDKVDGLSQAETWLEVCADDLSAAAGYLDAQGVVRRDEIEKLPEGFEGFWITNAAGIIHLVSRQRD